MINLIILGPPGAGKGTQAKNIQDKYNLVHISTGDIIRQELKQDTELAKKARTYTSKGKLVPDELINAMFKKAVNENMNDHGFIFDGFPRNLDQVEALNRILKEHKTNVTAVIGLEVPEEEIISRLKQRAEQEGREDDKDEKVIKNRLEVYKKNTQPLIDYYKNLNKYEAVNGVGSMEEIKARIFDIIDNL